MNQQRLELDALEPLVLVAIRRVSHLSQRAYAANLSDIEAELLLALLHLGNAHSEVCDRALKTAYSNGQLMLNDHPEDLPF